MIRACLCAAHQRGGSACLGEERGGVGEREESQRETHAGGEMKHSVFEDDDQHMMAHFWLGFW